MITNIESLVKRITDELKSFTDVAVLGMSGGADSTLVATLCTLALGKESVFGVGMPYSQSDSDTFNSRSFETAIRLGIYYRRVPIKEQVDAIIKPIELDPKEPPNAITIGNTKARVRMVILYGFANHIAAYSKNNGKRVRVIGTGNFSEDYIGYDTKGGDALADIFPIGSLFKSEVYQLLDYFIAQGVLKEEDVDRVPSAGLWAGQTDEGELGATYADMQTAIEYLVDEDLAPFESVLVPDERVANMVALRHKNNKHKHMAPPIINLREFCDWKDEGGYFDGKE